MRPDLKKSSHEKILGNSILGRGNTCSFCGQNKISLLKNNGKKPVSWNGINQEGRDEVREDHTGPWGEV